MKAALFLLCLTFLACNNDQNPPPGGNPDAAQPMTLPVTLAPNEAMVLSSQAPTPYSVLELRDLWLAVTVPSALPDVALLHVQTFMPDGTLFASYNAAYSGDPAAHPQTTPAGWNVPIDVRKAYVNNGQSVLTYAIPISGSDYERHPAPGLWKIRVVVDGIASNMTDVPVELRKN